MLELFIWGLEWLSIIQIGGLSYIERSERRCIRNRSGVGRSERGLVCRKDGVGREERDLSVGASGIQRVSIGERYALQSERVIFYPIIPDQAIKIGRGWSAVWCECSFTCRVRLSNDRSYRRPTFQEGKISLRWHVSIKKNNQTNETGKPKWILLYTCRLTCGKGKVLPNCMN